MKKIVSLLLAAMLFVACLASLAEVPEGYPEIIEGLDFGGATVYIYDWYSTGEREADPTDDQLLTYEYWDWLQETYNVTIVETTLSTWEGNPEELQNRVMNHDDSELCIIGIGGGFAGPALSNGLYMPWTYGLENFNEATEEFMTINGVCYGVSGTPYVEPRQCVFFNKQVLEDANIDWEELYDLQAAGEWTWDKMEEYMDKVQQDLDNDGVYDVYALTGNGDDVLIGLVVSNEGDFFDFDENGKLIYTGDKDNNTMEALARRVEWGDKYMRPNENWDDYQRFWPEGNVAFFLGQSYEGFNGNSTVNGIERWGCVALPMGPAATRYTSAADNNVFGVPNVYDAETALKLQQLYTLYRMPAPGMDEDSWSNAYYALTDDRAIEETYAMLRQGEHATIMKWNYLGDRNSVLGSDIMWNLWSGTPAEVLEAARPAMENRCANFNGDTVAE